MMPAMIELIYDADCPNVGHARENLARALTTLHLPAKWKEWERSAVSSPIYAARHGSPTILVAGKDVTDSSSAGDSCRIYRDDAGKVHRAPPVDHIVAALKTAATG